MMNKASRNTLLPVFDHKHPFLLNIFLGVVLLDHRVAGCLLEQILPDTLAKWLYPFAFLPLMSEGTNFTTSSSILGIVHIFSCGHSVVCMLGSHWVCICISLMSCDVETIWVFSFDQCLYHLSAIFSGQACLLYKGNMNVKCHYEEKNAAWLHVQGVLPVQ